MISCSCQGIRFTLLLTICIHEYALHVSVNFLLLFFGSSLDSPHDLPRRLGRLRSRKPSALATPTERSAAVLGGQAGVVDPGVCLYGTMPVPWGGPGIWIHCLANLDITMKIVGSIWVAPRF